MLGPIAPLSGDTKACDLEKYKCSDCDLIIRKTLDHTLACTRFNPHESQSNAQPSQSPRLPLPSSYMPQQALQPRRTWSAEDERRRRLEEDPDAYDVGPHSVTCAGCHRPIRLNATGRYYAANWNKHKMGCKNTNAVNGAGAVSADSKFTGRVAAFRVAKPSETAETLSHDLHPNLSGSEAQHSARSLHEVSAHHYTHRQDSPSSSKTKLDITHLDETHSFRGRINRDPYDRIYTEVPHTPAGTNVNGRDMPHNQRHSTLPQAPYMKPESGVESLKCQARSFEPASRTQNGQPRCERRNNYRYDSSPFEELRPAEKSPLLTTMEPTLCAPDQSDPYLKGSLDCSRFSVSSHSSRDRDWSRRATSRHENRSINFNPNSTSQRQGPQSSDPRKYLRILTSPFDRYHINKNYYKPDEEGYYASELETCSTVSSPEPEASPPSQNRKYSPHMNSRTLPSLRSLSISQRTATDNLPRVSSEETLHPCSLNKDRHHRDRLKLPPLVPVLNRERGGDVDPVYKRAQSNDLESDFPGSVVLPPIRTPQSPVHTSGLKRRLGQDKQEDEEQEEHRPSPPKVFVLPRNSSNAPSTLRRDDSTLKYNLKSAPRATSEKPENLHEDATTKRPSQLVKTAVGSSSPYHNSLSDSSLSVEGNKEGGVRLHPVWKWDQNEDVEVPNEISPEEETDIEMDMHDSR